MASEDVLKEYLVKMGFQVDDSSYKKVMSTFSNLEKLIGNNLSATSLASLKASTTIVGAMAAIAASIVKTIDAVAQADMHYQLLAQRMFMSVNAAKAFTIATETLGHNLQEIAWNAELKQKYFALVQQINELETPPEAKEMFKEVRAISFEFTRLKVDAKYAVENIAYEILKLNKSTLFELHENLKGIGEYLRSHIKEGAAEIAKYFQVVVEVFKVFGRVVGDVIVPAFKAFWAVVEKVVELFKMIWDMLPPIGRQAVVLGGLLLAAFLPISPPILAATAALTALYLLFDDFYAFMEGRDSSELLKPLWEVVDILHGELSKGIANIIILADRAWHALKGEKYPDKRSMLQQMDETAAEIDKEREKILQERADKRVAYEQAKRRAAEAQAAAASSAAPMAVSTVPAPAGESAERRLLDQIARGEGTSDEKARQMGYASGYDVTLGYGKYAKSEKGVSQMTFAELEAHQREMIRNQIKMGIDPKKASSAAGKYQFTMSTLFGTKENEGLLKQLGVSKEAVFTPEMQDKLALALIAKETEKFKAGKMSEKDYQNVIAGRWASVAMYGTDRSRYGQGVGTSGEEIAAVMRDMRKSSSYAAVSGGVHNEATTNNLTVNVVAKTDDPKQLGQVAGREATDMLQRLRADKAKRVAQNRVGV